MTKFSRFLLFLVIFAGIVAGLLIGFVWEWLREHRFRSTAARERRERERLEREIQLTREIQQVFIPAQLPALHGWELAAMWQAARQVAGDFYDLIELPDKKLGLVVADVGAV